MRLSVNFKGTVAAAFAVSLLLGLGACSDSKEDEEKLKPEGKEAAEPQASEPAPAAEATAAAEPAPAPAPTAAAAPAPTPAPTATVEKNRVVRFVSAEEAAITVEPKDGAATVGKLVKGDKVMVVEQNGWGRITDNKFVKLDHLSNKGVAHDRQPAVWQAPAH